MKVAVIGCGIVGSKLVAMLRNRDHQVVVATPRTGVNTLTGVGLAAALEGADVVVDTINSRFDGDAALLEFFEAWARNVIAAEAAAGAATSPCPPSAVTSAVQRTSPPDRCQRGSGSEFVNALLDRSGDPALRIRHAHRRRRNLR